MRGAANKLDYILTTIFSLEPRYYYNVERRISKNKKIINNSANFFALNLVLIPDIGTTTNRDGLGVDKSFALIPKYGFRRMLTDRLNFHFAIGIGYQWTDKSSDGVAVGLDLKIDFNLL